MSRSVGSGLRRVFRAGFAAGGLSSSAVVLLGAVSAVCGAEPVGVPSEPGVTLAVGKRVLREHTTSPGRCVVTVARTGPTDGPLTVRLHMNPNGGYAANGVDVEKVAEEVTIPAGKVSAEIEVRVINDEEVEGDEVVDMIVAPSDGYAWTPETQHVLVTIRDNDFWRWGPVEGRQLSAADVSQRVMLPNFDGVLQEAAWMSLDGSVRADDDSLKADLKARFFDGGLLRDTDADSEEELDLGFDFHPVSGDIYRSRSTGRAVVLGVIPADLAHSVVIDNSGSARHTAKVSVALVAAVKGRINVKGDGFFRVGSEKTPPGPLAVSVTKTDPAGKFLEASTELTVVLERFERDFPAEPVEAPRDVRGAR